MADNVALEGLADYPFSDLLHGSLCYLIAIKSSAPYVR